MALGNSNSVWKDTQSFLQTHSQSFSPGVHRRGAVSVGSENGAARRIPSTFCRQSTTWEGTKAPTLKYGLRRDFLSKRTVRTAGDGVAPQWGNLADTGCHQVTKVNVNSDKTVLVVGTLGVM